VRYALLVTLEGTTSKIGIREGSGFGSGLAPSFVDAGCLRVSHAELIFEGLFSRRVFNGPNISRIEKQSSNKIRVDSNDPSASPSANTCLIALKDQFYPFRSRSSRDKILRALGSLPAQAQVSGTAIDTSTGS